ncbi:MAG TPA: trypsin-like peptidase domain-containing protein [Pirellulales bacterium]|nr:trypsin-like peptidase domain-containing protein [Pirellulales bacterium]
MYQQRSAIGRLASPSARTGRLRLGALAALLCFGAAQQQAQASPSFAAVVRGVQPKIVKIYGAGGFRGLEPYQSGFLISPEGHVLTVWSYVLDTEFITVTLDDGRKFEAKLLGADPRLELALLKIEAADLPYFDLAQAAAAETGTRVLAFSNLFGVATGDEPASVQHGSVAVKSRLEARRGVFETPYRGDVYVLDAMTNNPGAAGGALTDRQGRLLGMLGKELRNSLNGAWLNYAVPTEALAPTVAEIRSGKFVARSPDADQDRPEHALSADVLGLVLVPDVLDRTPPYIDRIRSGSPAAKAGLRPDDLVVFVNNQLVQSCQTLTAEIERIDRADRVRLTVLRDQKLVEAELEAERSNP